MKRKIIISSGDPAGIGPIISLEAIKNSNLNTIDFFLIGDSYIFESIPLFRRLKGRINFIDLKTPGIRNLQKGSASKLSGKASIGYLNKSLELIKAKLASKLITAPISKEAVEKNILNFKGHTEYLRKYFALRTTAMMMVSKKMRLVLLTRHQPLKKVSSLIKADKVKETICLIHKSLKSQFKIKRPKIALASFNPHAGVDTFFGNEERTLIKAAKMSRIPVFGPYPADTIFIESNLNKFDSVICTYHDQAMIPFKLLSFYDGVNLTLGLPIIRTSPAHGVAYDLINKNKRPISSSMEAAIKLAVDLSS
tara:strand:- start:3409 stop:4335 length:927 start_codon:yes stop_codon:yes gene_type:complete